MPGAVNAYAEDSLPTSRTCPVTHFVAVSAIRRIGVYGYSPSFVFSAPHCQSETLFTGIPIGGDDFSLTFLLFADFFFDTSPFPFPCRDHLVDGLWHREGRLLFRHFCLRRLFFGHLRLLADITASGHFAQGRLSAHPRTPARRTSSTG